MRTFFLLTIFLLMCLTCYSQAFRKNSSSFNTQNKQNKFLEKQWWLGFKGGVNFSEPVMEKSYSVKSPTNYPPTETTKEYENYSSTGSQVTVEVTFYYKGYSFSLQPTYRHSSFVYTTQSAWYQDDVPVLELDYNQNQQIDYMDIPFLARYDLTKTRLSPYVQVGAYYAILINANKSIGISGIDYASGGENRFTDPDIIVGAEDLFAKYNWGLMAGAGVNYQIGNIRLNLDLMYRKGMSLINSTENRYSNKRLTGAGDVMDDIKMNNISVSIGALFPLRFLSSGFKSSDRL